MMQRNHHPSMKKKEEALRFWRDFQVIVEWELPLSISALGSFHFCNGV